MHRIARIARKTFSGFACGATFNKHMKKKLIEVSLPLDAINKYSVEEKSVPRHGHPQTMHLWWARRPLATCRAVLFASLVDDPSSNLELYPTEVDQAKERRRLHNIIEELVKWENSNNEVILNKARQEILKSTNGNPPAIFDPFSGGCSIPLEGQRLGLDVSASDLNPVAVLISKALIEIAPNFAGKPPVNSESREKTNYTGSWHGSRGISEDIRYYGKQILKEAEKLLREFYPKINDESRFGSKSLNPLAWIWARTVECSNPTCKAEMPLVRSFIISQKKNAKTWVEPIINQADKYYTAPC